MFQHASRFKPVTFLSALALALAIPRPALAQAFPEVELTVEQQGRLDELKAAGETIDGVADPHAYRDAWEEALAYAEAIYPAGHPELHLIKSEIGFSWFMLGEIERTVEILQGAEEAFARAGPAYREQYIETVNNLGVNYDALGRSEEGISYQRRAVALWREDAPPEGSPELVQGLNNLAWSERQQGNTQTAYDMSVEALAMADRLLGAADGEPGDVLKDGYIIGVNNQVVFLVGLGRDADAQRVVRNGVVRAAELFGADHPRVASLLLNGSILAVRSGQYAEGERLARRALEIRDAAYGPDSPTSAEARLNLLQALSSQGRFAEALPLAEYTVEVLERAQGPTGPQTLEARARLSAVYFGGGRIEEGIAATQDLVDTFKEIRDPGHEDIEWYQQRLAILLGRAARWDEALPVLVELEESRSGTADEFLKDHAATLALRAVAEAKTGNVQAARAYLDRAEPVLKAVWRSEVENEGASGQSDRFTDWALGWLALTAGDIGEEERSFQLAQYVGVGASERSLLRARQRAQTDDPEVAAALRARQDLVEQREGQIAMFASAASEGNAAATAAANGEIERLSAEIDAMGAIPAPLLAPESASDIASRLAPDGALLFIAETDIHTRIYAVTREGLVVEDSPRPTLAIEQLVARLRDNLEAGIAQGAEYDKAAALELHEALFTPRISAALEGKEQISVIARGELAKLPFSILVDAQGAFALESHAFAYPIELSAVGAHRPATTRQFARFLGLGAPALPGPVEQERAFRGPENAMRVLGLGPLGLAEGELLAMAAAVQAQDTQILVGADATEAAMRLQDLRRADFLTFATHGLMAGELEGLDEAALVLSPPREGEDVGPGNDGLLTTSEIAALDLNARWVILSACNSASGNGANDEAFGGLAQAFLYAGAESLLASHWRVRDDAAARLTVATAEGTAAGLSPAESLRRAKIDLMRDGSVAMGSHPAIWAPFVFVGG